MKYKIFIFIVLASFIIIQPKELYCMEPEPEIRQDLITLVGSDGDELSILRELAMQSGTIRSFLEMPGSLEARTSRIEFREIPTTHLKTIFKLQQAIMERATKDPEILGAYVTSSVQEIVDRMLTGKNPEELQDLLLISNFLDLLLLKDSIAHLWVYIQPKVPLQELKEGVVAELYDLIEKHWQGISFCRLYGNYCILYKQKW